MIKGSAKYRFERKYLLDEETTTLLKKRMAYVLKPDNAGIDGRYHISSLYFDDFYSTSFFEKQDGILSRDKFRLRFYDNSFKVIKLERKHKHGDMVYKDSAMISLEQYQRMLQGEYGFMRDEEASVFKKFYTAHVLRRMKPVVMVEYDRQAYIYPAGNVRITFDENLAAGLPAIKNTIPGMARGYTILEVKYDRFIPSFIVELLAGIQMTQQLPISKFIITKTALQGGQYK